jgi:hypothetical protein
MTHPSASIVSVAGAESWAAAWVAPAGLKRRCDQQPVGWSGSDLGGGWWSCPLVYRALRRVLELVLLVLGPLLILGPLGMLVRRK